MINVAVNTNPAVSHSVAIGAAANGAVCGLTLDIVVFILQGVIISCLSSATSSGQIGGNSELPKGSEELVCMLILKCFRDVIDEIQHWR